MAEPLIIVGASTRAAAQSAIRAGYQPWCVDMFADRDLREIATVKLCPRNRYPEAIPELLADAPANAPVLCGGAMENHLDVVEKIARDRSLLGASPDAIRLARDPLIWQRLPRIGKIRYCETAVRSDGASVRKLERIGGPNLLNKPFASAGGRGIHGRMTRNNEKKIDFSQYYLQEFIPGEPVCALYWTNAGTGETRLLGASFQIVGDGAFGIHGFGYCGAIGPMPLSDEQHHALATLGQTVADACKLTGLFGIDFILNNAGQFCPIEINPRYTAGAEILERASDLKVLAPEPTPPTRPASHGFVGKAIVYAIMDVVALDIYEIVPRTCVADVPAVGEAIPLGHPICTVFAAGQTRVECLARLRDYARHIYTRVQL